jgi:hypothetical protein
MQTLLERIQQEGPQVVQNSDYLYKSDIKWRDDIEYKSPNEYETELLKNTIKPEVLIEKEKTEEQIIINKKREIITKVKVVALSKMGCYPLCNPSFFSRNDKEILKDHMQQLLDLPEDEMTKLFNETCTDKIFTDKSDYSQFPTYSI